MSIHPQHPRARPRYGRREFLRRAAAAGIAVPGVSAILAACGSGAETGVSQSPTASGASGTNKFGTGGIAGAPYPLARQNAPVTWTIQPDNQPIASGLPAETNATLQVLRWPYYLDDGVLKAFQKANNCKIQITEFTDMDKGLAKINSGQGTFDMLVGMNVWAIGRSIAAGLLRPYNHDYIPNLAANVWDTFQSPFYDVHSQFSVPYSVWSTGIFWRNDKLSFDPSTMSNPYDVFWDNPPKQKTHLLANAQDVLALAMFHDGVKDVNVTDPAAITKAKDEIAQIAAAAGGVQYDHVDYTDVPAGKAWLHQSWSGNVSDAVVFLPDKSKADNLSYYWPGSQGHPANVDNDTTVLLKTGKNPVLAHKLVDWLLDPAHALTNFTDTTGYQSPLKAMTPDAMTSSGIVPEHLSSVIVAESDFVKGSRELELPPDADALWQQAFSELQAGV
ncbi:MAG TPA: extracellular solute-binding protein [Actinomycetota bacterium]|jgi:spermidine/putrescine transport system substrate-binding protein